MVVVGGSGESRDVATGKARGRGAEGGGVRVCARGGQPSRRNRVLSSKDANSGGRGSGAEVEGVVRAVTGQARNRALQHCSTVALQHCSPAWRGSIAWGKARGHECSEVACPVGRSAGGAQSVPTLDSRHQCHGTNQEGSRCAASAVLSSSHTPITHPSRTRTSALAAACAIITEIAAQMISGDYNLTCLFVTPLYLLVRSSLVSRHTR